MQSPTPNRAAIFWSASSPCFSTSLPFSHSKGLTVVGQTPKKPFLKEKRRISAKSLCSEGLGNALDYVRAPDFAAKPDYRSVSNVDVWGSLPSTITMCMIDQFSDIGVVCYARARTKATHEWFRGYSRGFTAAVRY